MLARHRITGQIVQLPDNSPLYTLNEVVYDGFGNPVGIAPILAALAPIAKSLIPTLVSAIPSIIGGGARSSQPEAAPPPPMPMPAAVAPAPPPEPPRPVSPMAPSEGAEPWAAEDGPATEMPAADPRRMMPTASFGPGPARPMYRVLRRPLRRPRRILVRRRPLLNGYGW
jgi:hypothetical protein